jgi:hypothetical protein
VEILDTSNNDVVIRDVELTFGNQVPTTKLTYQYTASQQIADFGTTVPIGLKVRITEIQENGYRGQSTEAVDN